MGYKKVENIRVIIIYKFFIYYFFYTFTNKVKILLMNKFSALFTKKILIITLLITAIISCSKKKNDNSCFSEGSFKTVNAYIKSKTEASKLGYFPYKTYHVFCVNTNEIVIRKNKEIIGKITKDKGVFAIAKYKSDNEKLTLKVQNLFCELVSEIEN